MDKQLYNPTKLVCDYCKKEFLIAARNLKYQRKKGQKNFCCSWSCASSLRADSAYDISKHAGNLRDDLSPYRVFLRAIKKTSKLRNWSITVTLEDLRNQRKIQQDKCPYSSIVMIFPASMSEYDKLHDLRKASLDRIDSSKPYSVDNIQFLPMSLNWAKNKHTDEDFRKFIDEIRLLG